MPGTSPGPRFFFSEGRHEEAGTNPTIHATPQDWPAVDYRVQLPALFPFPTNWVRNVGTPSGEWRGKMVVEEMRKDGWGDPPSEPEGDQDPSADFILFWKEHERRCQRWFDDPPLSPPRGYRDKALKRFGLSDLDVWAALHWMNRQFASDVARARERPGGLKDQLAPRWIHVRPEFWEHPFSLRGKYIILPRRQLLRGQWRHILRATWYAVLERERGNPRFVARGCELAGLKPRKTTASGEELLSYEDRWLQHRERIDKLIGLIALLGRSTLRPK